jgi:arylsulfatase A-like enzyme
MTELADRGLKEKTIIVVTGDHGESLWQHGLPTHGEALYREQIHVPLIFWYPGHLPSGVRVSTNVTNAAIPATLIAVLGNRGHSEFPGPALDSLWTNPETKWPDPISELSQDKYLPKQNRQPETQVPTATTGSMQTLVEGQWQLIEHTKFGSQLYDWIHDPKEVNDSSRTPEGKDLAERLSAHLRDTISPKAADK